MIFPILGLEGTYHWIGLTKQPVTGSWIWDESEEETNFTPWLYTANYPCVATTAPANGWLTLPCTQDTRGSACEMYDVLFNNSTLHF